ncbi:Uncharacterized protein FWK35_00027940 [Aphis craccivora]|uniref:FLYWCH-type domain-containing protein n=1 Tax=Aphis craccivora TaxID=307492 RepID=A0A6G0YAG2_APHCR|nr:Uncharacterized protein FWK35_00027940 [Aphis craccivora]
MYYLNEIKAKTNGYMHVMKHAGKNYYTWRCNKKSSLNCPAILHNSINKTDPILKCSGANPSQMYAEAVSQLDVYTKARMPVENSLKRTIRNYRKNKNPIDPGDPASLEELQILVPYELFLFLNFYEICQNHENFQAFEIFVFKAGLRTYWAPGLKFHMGPFEKTSRSKIIKLIVYNKYQTKLFLSIKKIPTKTLRQTPCKKRSE